MSQQLSEDLVWSQLVARAWCDEGFRKRLRSDPRNVLAEHGMEVPQGMDVKVVEGAEAAVVDDPGAVRYLTLPASPPDELAEEHLVGDVVAWCGACGGCGCRCRC
jgi:hypothetical protein